MNGLLSLSGPNDGVGGCFDITCDTITNSRRPLAGDIIYVNVLGKQFIFLHSAEDATALLDKRGTMYSDRPTFPMGGELVGWEGSLALTQYNDRFKEFRRYMSRVMGTKSALRPFQGLIETESRKFLKRLLQTPEEVHEHIRK